jgi:hypothetical protein
VHAVCVLRVIEVEEMHDVEKIIQILCAKKRGRGSGKKDFDVCKMHKKTTHCVNDTIKS